MTPWPTALFSSDLISAAVQSQLPEGYLMRPLEITDYHKGFYDCLAGLTVVGKVSEESFRSTFEKMCQGGGGVYHIVVIEDLAASRIVATGTLVVEQKFLRSCGKAGHIEDIVVHDSQRGKKFGIRLIDQLKHIGTSLGCYKLLLTCSEENEPFYEKTGFKRKDLHLAQYLPASSSPPAPSTTTSAITTTTYVLAAPASVPKPIQPVQPVSTMVIPAPETIHVHSNITSSPSKQSLHGIPLESLSASMESVFVK